MLWKFDGPYAKDNASFSSKFNPDFWSGITVVVVPFFKVNSLYIAKFIFSYYQRLLPSAFLNLFLTGGKFIIMILY